MTEEEKNEKKKAYSRKKLNEIEDKIENLKLPGLIIDVLIFFFRGIIEPIVLLITEIVILVINLPMTIWVLIKVLYCIIVLISAIVLPLAFIYYIITLIFRL